MNPQDINNRNNNLDDNSFNRKGLSVEEPNNNVVDARGLSREEADKLVKDKLAATIKENLDNRPVNVQGDVKAASDKQIKPPSMDTPFPDISPTMPSIKREDSKPLPNNQPFLKSGQNMGQQMPHIDNRDETPTPSGTPNQEAPSKEPQNNIERREPESSLNDLEDDYNEPSSSRENHYDEEYPEVIEEIVEEESPYQGKNLEPTTYVSRDKVETLKPIENPSIKMINKKSTSNASTSTSSGVIPPLAGEKQAPSSNENQEKDKDKEKENKEDNKEKDKESENKNEKKPKEEGQSEEQSKDTSSKEEVEETTSSKDKGEGNADNKPAEEQTRENIVEEQAEGNIPEEGNKNAPEEPEKEHPKEQPERENKPKEEPKIGDNSSYSTKNRPTKNKPEEDAKEKAAAGIVGATANKPPVQPRDNRENTVGNQARNLNNKKMSRAEAANRTNQRPKTKVSRSLNNKSGKAKSKTGGGASPKSGSGDLSNASIKRKIKKKLLLLAMKLLPFVLIFFLLMISFMFIAAIIVSIVAGDGESSDSDSYNVTSPAICKYNIEGMSFDGLKVDILNCEATEDNYTVTSTVDFDKYVIGVALAEISGNVDKETFKAQIIAARNFALTRGKSVCPDRQDTCYIGLQKSTNTIKIRGCSKDQQYCDYDSNCNITEEKKLEVIGWADEVKGQVLKDAAGNIVTTNYNQTDQASWLNSANSGLSGPDIIKNYYEQSGTLASGECRDGGTSGDGSYATPTSISSYNLSTDGATILHEPLATFLSNHGSSITNFNAKLKANIDSAGYQTREGVVAAAVTLIGELYNNYKVKIPYYWSGGHRGAIYLAKDDWGANTCHTKQFGNSYDYCGVDCSGFVAWAIYNGGFKYANHSNSFLGESGAKEVKLTSSRAVVQPGDLLQSSGHVVLVVGIDESKKEYIVAEATGLNYGVQFKRRKFNASGYIGVDLTEFYQKDKNKRG